MSDPYREILSTSVMFDLGEIDSKSLPDDPAVAVVILAELAAGPHASVEEEERVRR